MQYTDGQEVQPGDRIRLASDDGVVVCVIDSGQYSDKYPEAEWSYLEKGMLIEFPRLGLVHYPECDLDLKLIGRSQR
ncbi:MAG: hypothetical protein LBB55_03860 [Zoogloeaceae bacterium]|jgi:hypothetical protein|nr:hypothetical protein [Zoogloeaceae bacterium]